MIKYFCDRCEMELTDRIDYVLFGTKRDGETAVDNDTKNCHFCKNCAEKIKKYALTPGKSEKNGREIGKSGNAQHTKKTTKIDTGKIIALRKAGWSVAKIADEMNLTSQQIYSQIAYQKKKEEQE